MAIRNVIYVATLYDDLLKQKRLTADGKLPPVLPMVLYNGQKPWRAPLSIQEMIADVPEGLQRYQPQMAYVPARRAAHRGHVLRPGG